MLICLVIAVAMLVERGAVAPSVIEARTTQVPSAALSIELSGPFGPMFAGEMAAVRNGLFDHEDLSVELSSAENADDPIDFVAQGVDRVGVTSSEKFLLARAKGLPIVAFMAGLLKSPVVLYSMAASGIHAPADFADKRIGVQAGQDTALIYEAMMARLSLSRSIVHEVPVGTDPEPLIAGNVDVWPGHVGVDFV